MGFGADDLYSRDRNHSVLSQQAVDAQPVVEEVKQPQIRINNLNIVEVGSNLISPRHSFTEEENEDDHQIKESKQDQDIETELNEKHILEKIHKKQDSLLATLAINPIIEESSQLTQNDPVSRVNSERFLDDEQDLDKEEEKKEDEQKQETQEIQQENKENKEEEEEEEKKPARNVHKARISRHRVLRVKHHGMASDDEDNDDLDQTPMDLAKNARPATVGGHRYIPSFDSTHSMDMDMDFNEVLSMDSVRSESYVPWTDRQRQDSFISELGDYDFLASDIQPWPMEGDADNDNHDNPLLHQHDDVANLAGYTPVAGDAFASSKHQQFPSNIPLYIVSKPKEINPARNDLLSQHKVDEDDENVGDSIF